MAPLDKMNALEALRQTTHGRLALKLSDMSVGGWFNVAAADQYKMLPTSNVIMAQCTYKVPYLKHR